MRTYAERGAQFDEAFGLVTRACDLALARYRGQRNTAGMNMSIDLWPLLAGIGLFLFGMHQLEDSLTCLAGRSFKRFLKRHTAPPIRGVIAGALSTAALQSSSVVSLIVLAFVATEIVSLAGALAIVFGANLGTTATGWLVATVGFKFDIEAIALPLIAVGGAGVALARRKPALVNSSRLALGFGLMLLALAFMKEGVASVSHLFDPAALSGKPLVVFLVAGMLITAVVQSSSATIMITLSALDAGILTLPAAMAVAIGADLGTTTTSLLGTVAGSASKRRVAAGIILFNVVTDVLAFLLLAHLLTFIKSTLHITDPLFTLVAFHTLFNLLGLAMFLPAITPLSRYLERFFGDADGHLLHFITSKDFSLPASSIENIERETARLLDQVATVNQTTFKLDPARAVHANPRPGSKAHTWSKPEDVDYEGTKELEGAILAHCLELQKVQLSARESVRLNQLIQANRHGIHAAKSIRDTAHDLQQMERSESDAYHSYTRHFRDDVEAFYLRIRDLDPATLEGGTAEMLAPLSKCNADRHRRMHDMIYDEIRSDMLNRLQTSTLLNVNREIYNSNESYIAALGDLLIEHRTTTDADGVTPPHAPEPARA